MKISHKELADSLSVSAETLRRHKRALEGKYGTTFGTVNGTRITYTAFEASLLSDSIKKKKLPDSIVVDSDDEVYPTTTYAITRVDAAERDQSTDIVLCQYDLAPLKHQVAQDAKQIREGIDTVVLHIVAQHAEKLGLQIQEEYLYHISEAQKSIIKAVSNVENQG
jgi:hypothetical protein